MTLRERLNLFLSEKNLSQGKFEKAAGLSNGFVNSIGEGISTQSLIKILEAYPDLNATWLLTGTGEMILTESFLLNEGKEGYKTKPAPGEMPADLLSILKNEVVTMQASLDKLARAAGVQTSSGNTGDHPAKEDLSMDKKHRTLRGGKNSA